VKAKKRFGQHFLLPDWADKVVAAIAPSPADRFVEIGPGPGVLTTRLAARAGRVTAIEIDRDLAASLTGLGLANLDVVTGDVLAIDLTSLVGEGPVRVAGNLPYNISSPILFALLTAQRRGQSPFFANKGDSRPISDATLMLQREVADRLVATPGTKDYGVLTIFAAAHANVARVLALPPGAFRPPPKVHSALVRLTFVPPRVPAELDATFEPMVRVMFTQRRKTVANALKPFADARGRDARSALTAAGIDPACRPETLDLPALVRLSAALAAPQG
jgi:16S rRNA (adenine1518-N6/adenine1519-N6)-dimethyltransferase